MQFIKSGAKNQHQLEMNKKNNTSRSSSSNSSSSRKKTKYNLISKWEIINKIELWSLVTFNKTQSTFILFHFNFFGLGWKLILNWTQNNGEWNKFHHKLWSFTQNLLLFLTWALWVFKFNIRLLLLFSVCVCMFVKYMWCFRVYFFSLLVFFYYYYYILRSLKLEKKN